MRTKITITLKGKDTLRCCEIMSGEFCHGSATRAVPFYDGYKPMCAKCAKGYFGAVKITYKEIK